MTRLHQVQHQFVEFIPEQLETGLLYVSMQYTIVAHLCCCGCGREVVTPLAPHRWKLAFDGRSISLSPSIGSWSFPCQSHYWIRNNQVEWSIGFTRAQVERARANDRRLIEEAVEASPAASSQTSVTRFRRTRWLFASLRRRSR